MAYDGDAVHILDVQDRWARSQRLYPASGASVGVCED
jgi:hypothetical protein